MNRVRDAIKREERQLPMFLLRGASPSPSLIPSEFWLQMSNLIQKQPLPGFVTRNDNRPPQMRMWLYVIATLLVLGFGVGVEGKVVEGG